MGTSFRAVAAMVQGICESAVVEDIPSAESISTFYSVHSRTPSMISAASDCRTIAPPCREAIEMCDELLGPHWRDELRERPSS